MEEIPYPNENMKTDPRIDAEKELSDTVGQKRIRNSHYGNGKRLAKHYT